MSTGSEEPVVPGMRGTPIFASMLIFFSVYVFKSICGSGRGWALFVAVS